MKLKMLFICLFLSACNSNAEIVNDKPLSLIKDKGTILFEDKFDGTLDKWMIEEPKIGEITIISNGLDVDTAEGATAWFKEDIQAPAIIEFDGLVVVNGGPQDKGSDLNFFWMAHMPDETGFFTDSATRLGRMRSYDAMKLYYVGYGANYNSTTRLRIYPRDRTTDKNVMPAEYDLKDSKFMHTPNVSVNIKIVHLGNEIYVYRNNEKVFEVKGDDLYQKGKFGVRTWDSHIRIHNFKVYQLK